MSRAWVEETIDYLIPEKCRGTDIPETNIIVPPEAYGASVEPAFGCSEDKGKSVVFWYDELNVLEASGEIGKPVNELREILKEYFTPVQN
jgi:hypothetical protein